LSVDAGYAAEIRPDASILPAAPNDHVEVPMAHYVTTVRTPRTADEAFAYMADLRNFAQWDPGVRAVEQVHGEGGGLDATFDVAVAAAGRDLTLRYVTEEYDAPSRVLVGARSSMFTSIDLITVETDDEGTLVTYDAELTLNGVLGIADPLLRLAFGRIGDRAAAGLREALQGATVQP